MAKHIMDRPRTTDSGSRVKAYLGIDRAEHAPGRREQALYRAATDPRDHGQRLREYTRIERESDA
ncbi:MAG: hypothetical protein KGI94_04435 [Paracoccaceae bacterium]|nr:hypothetical protein [Paracoccaceae bacterium]MDE3122760.1 hypothetical protein [Paracoccaceae bacterium]MDE3238659.1 hypothetical protein [Paracoccaceae bacterium]